MTDIEAERGELSTRLAGAPDRDLEEAAKWERGGRRGTAPEPSRPALEVDHAALLIDTRSRLDCRCLERHRQSNHSVDLRVAVGLVEPPPPRRLLGGRRGDVSVQRRIVWVLQPTLHDLSLIHI